MDHTQTIHVVGAAIIDAGECLVAQRAQDMSLPGKWEFPGGKVDDGERPHAALVRELREELDVAVVIGEWLGRGEARVGQKRIVLDVFAARVAGRAMHVREHAEIRWVAEPDLKGLDWAEADIPIVPFVQAYMNAGAPSSSVPGAPARTK